MKRALFFLALLFAFTASHAGSGIPLLDSANAAYNRKDFQKAVTQYEQLIGLGTTAPEIYYNLGNSYYRLNRTGYAILNYERAHKLAPADPDITHNLELARQRAVDKTEDAGELLGDAWHGFLSILGERGWSWLSAILLLLTCAAFGAYLWSRKRRIKILLFSAGCILLCSAVFSFICAKQEYRYTYATPLAILVQQEVIVRSAPSAKSGSIATLHEGTKVRVLGNEGEWLKIGFGNETVGWVKKEQAEEI